MSLHVFFFWIFLFFWLINYVIWISNILLALQNCFHFTPESKHCKQNAANSAVTMINITCITRHINEKQRFNRGPTPLNIKTCCWWRHIEESQTTQTIIKTKPMRKHPHKQDLYNPKNMLKRRLISQTHPKRVTKRPTYL